MDRGARTKQIRDALGELDKATPRDMLNIALDDRALFLKRWRDILINFRDPIYLRAHPARREALVHAEHWTGRAAIDDPGYRVVRAFRAAVQEDIYNDLIAAARKHFPDATFRPSARFEDTAWRIMTAQPEHLLNPEYSSWDMRIMASLDRALTQLQQECDVSVRKLSECTWGRRNTLRMQHPLADALPFLDRFLRMPREQLPGDNDMPRVQGVGFGASERFAVSPGREAHGYFHMPGGQSGHPLSPYFSVGHDAWVKGELTPFLPGATQHTLTLRPGE
jgi:penicillin amidase